MNTRDIRTSQFFFSSGHLTTTSFSEVKGLTLLINSHFKRPNMFSGHGNSNDHIQRLYCRVDAPSCIKVTTVHHATNARESLRYHSMCNNEKTLFY